jgi:hypothetical protein
MAFGDGAMNLPVLGKNGVTCRNLVKNYGSGDSRVRALRGLDLDVAPGVPRGLARFDWLVQNVPETKGKVGMPAGR